ncbi:MAG: 50S ribosomal protein L1 [Phycisphaerae bacterium]|nr:50S ribosomal protein L1 [Phycisphaerae bacterium]
MPKRARRYREMIEKGGDLKKAFPIGEAIEKIKAMAAVPVGRSYKAARNRKGFDQTVELVMHLGIDPRQADQAVRGSLSLPKGIGATKTVIAFCPEGMVEAAKAAGAVEAGGDELVAKITEGWMDFDVAIAHPQLMGRVGKLGRVLGPQGKMPSPKSGTVTPDVVTAVKEYAAGKVEYRNDDGGNVHAVVGKVSFASPDLQENIEAFVAHIRKAKPAAAKGQYIKKVAISATMTPGVICEMA